MAERGREGLSKFEVQPEETGEQQVHSEIGGEVQNPFPVLESPTSSSDAIDTSKQVQPSAEAPPVTHNAAVKLDRIPPPDKYLPEDLQDMIDWGDS